LTYLSIQNLVTNSKNFNYLRSFQLSRLAQWLPLLRILKIPANSLGDTRLNGFNRPIIKFSIGFIRIYRVAPIMTSSILNVLNQIGTGLPYTTGVPGKRGLIAD